MQFNIKEYKVSQDNPLTFCCFVVSFEEVRDCLISQKSVQKKYHDRRHNTKDLLELHPDQPVLFLSPKDTNWYIEGTITGPATTPHSHMLEAQGRTYCHSRHNIYPIDTDTTPFWRPSMHQGKAITGPSEQQIPPFEEPPVVKIAPLQDHLQEYHHKPPILLNKTQLNSLDKAAALP